MSNADTLREGSEAFGRGDLDAAVQNFADDIRWENPEAPQFPNNGVTQGKDAVKALFAELPNLLGVVQHHARRVHRVG